jgi:excinuclease ABC subunit C
LFLVQRLRDEAHRFAVGQHRSRRRRSTLSSKLDSVQGIGPARRKALLTTFGDVDGLRKAELSELAAIPGISLELAERVKAAL